MNIMQSMIRLFYSREFYGLNRRKYLLHCNGNVRRFYRAFLDNKWEDAVQIGQKLIFDGHRDRTILPAIARCFYRAGEPEKGESYVRTYLEAVTGKGMADLIVQWRAEAEMDRETIHTVYYYAGGAGNLGMLEHTDLNTKKRYLTKIMSNRLLPKPQILREHYFYEQIRAGSEALQSCTPGLICWNENKYKGETLYFLTIEKIEGRKPEQSDTEEILACFRKISGASFPQMRKLLMSSPPGGPVAFRLMHRATTHRLLLYGMRQRSKRWKSKPINEAIRSLQRVVLQDGLYRKIDPAKHYTLCHFDFHRGNLLIEQHSGLCVALDWSNYHLGLVGTDLITYFKNRRASFDEVERHYLSRLDSTDSKDHRIVSTMVLYGIVYRSIMQARRDTIGPLLTNLIHPAVERIQELHAHEKAPGSDR